MARQPLTLPAALDQYEDALAGIERRIPKLERATRQLAEVLKTTPTADSVPFAGDIDALAQRREAIKGRF